MKDIWKNPTIKSVLKERTADDIAVLNCPKCGEYGYYNEGSHFSCTYCKKSWYVCSEDEDPPDDRPYMYACDMVTLADTVEVDEDGP